MVSEWRGGRRSAPSRERRRRDLIIIHSIAVLRRRRRRRLLLLLLPFIISPSTETPTLLPPSFLLSLPSGAFSLSLFLSLAIRRIDGFPHAHNVRDRIGQPSVRARWAWWVGHFLLGRVCRRAVEPPSSVAVTVTFAFSTGWPFVSHATVIPSPLDVTMRWLLSPWQEIRAAGDF